MQHVSAATAAAILELFVRRLWELKDEEEMDMLFDILIALLERARDERWRLRKADSGDPPNDD